MTRRCSHCSNNGHNSRTCPAARSAAAASANSGSGGVRLFGVRLTEGVGSMKKSASMGNLPSHYSSSSSPSNNPGSPGSDPTRDDDAARSGYASDDPTHASCSSSNRSERKKGTPWTEEEHRMFLFGLHKLGKGDWRGIARNFVASRTPTQVASHAQKYFIRQTNASRRKRRSSLFDMVTEPEMVYQQMDHLAALDEQVMPRSPPESQSANQLPSLQLGQDQETEPTDPPPSSNPPQELKECLPYGNIPLPTPLPPGITFYTALLPMPYPFWPPAPTPPPKECMAETHEVLKPTPVLPKEPRNVDEVVGMSKLSIGEEGKTSRMEPSALSLKMLEASTSRRSAFHVNPTITGADLSPSNSSPIHAV